MGEERAIEDLAKHGWTTIERVGHEYRGYDLDCKDERGRSLHVEVKGTQTQGEKVELTEGERRHIQDTDCDSDHALYVVSHIEVNRQRENTCSGGDIYSIWPWAIDNEALHPTKYDYTVPTTQTPPV